MKILVIGSGGREHALTWKIAQSPLVEKIWCAPGNPGIAEFAECLPIAVTAVDFLLNFALEHEVDLTVVGPELPLTLGIVDRFREAGLAIFGPDSKAAELEGSKVFAKRLMAKYNIPTAAFATFTDYDAATAYIHQQGAPLVIKADGLAAGKGVKIAQTVDEALAAAREIMVDDAFGKAGRQIVVEEYLAGEEVSFFALTDGKTVVPLATCQDHKRVFDGDQGPNTGGMGAYSPAPIATAELQEQIMERIICPTIAGMAKEGRPYCGVLFAGLMITSNGPKTLEYNVRFGDPETQALMARMGSDLVPLLMACATGNLAGKTVEWLDNAAVCVVMASDGYPGNYRKGFDIYGLEDAVGIGDLVVFHAGTSQRNGRLITAGGRVLGVTGTGPSIAAAIEKAYDGVEKIYWSGVHYRLDIGHRALALEAAPQVGIVMGSANDYDIMIEAARILRRFGIPFEMTVASAHRSPHRAARYARSATERGLKVIIAGAGAAAHLAGALAAETTLPVLAVPLDSSSLHGLDALLSTVQMPAGVPVATMAIGAPGARNAGVLAAQILALSDTGLERKLRQYKTTLKDGVESKAASVAERLSREIWEN